MSPAARRRLEAAGWSAACSALFLVVYNACTWITARRSDVGSWCYGWEMHIPFLQWFVIPYWSIDGLFVLSFFLCDDGQEMRLLAKRISAAIVIGGSCFLLYPLKLCYPLPEVSGFPALLFAPLRQVTPDFNLLPSLHIALRTILADLYVRHTRGAWRWTARIWFSMIGFSTMLCHMHQIIDVVGGFILGALCLYAIEDAPALEVMPNRRVGTYYAAGAVAAAVCAALAPPWTAVLGWAALSSAIVAAAYFGVGPGIYRKRGGKLTLGTRLVLAPCLFGQRASLWWYQRQCRPWDEVAPGVWLGRRLDAVEAAGARNQGVRAVVDLTAEWSASGPFLEAAYLNIPILDLTAPTGAQLREAVAFIKAHVKKGSIVYVHCKIGYSRSAAAVAAYLLSAGLEPTPEAAIERIRRARPSLVVRPEAREAVREFKPA
ncbi:MAG: dual specificity protein phosphatase family protein [Elusimicrobia bacterium]|nr:dual specificity protein phosphatase family protein [Elusimicrobiota bacterium]